MTLLSLTTPFEVQQALALKIKIARKAKKHSRAKLAEISTVPAPTIKKFETTGQISLRQFILLWQSVADLAELDDLGKPQTKTPKTPKSIAEVLNAN